MQISQQMQERVNALLKLGRSIDAIRLVRDSGVSLLQAKRIVEAMMVPAEGKVADERDD